MKNEEMIENVDKSDNFEDFDAGIENKKPVVAKIVKGNKGVLRSGNKNVRGAKDEKPVVENVNLEDTAKNVVSNIIQEIIEDEEKRTAEVNREEEEYIKDQARLENEFREREEERIKMLEELEKEKDGQDLDDENELLAVKLERQRRMDSDNSQADL